METFTARTHNFLTTARQCNVFSQVSVVLSQPSDPAAITEAIEVIPTLPSIARAYAAVPL